jgi:DNA-binding transcriptional regulator YiaG
MPNIATVLKAEIQRLARKEIRTETSSLKKHRAEDRRAIAALKREVADLKRNQEFLKKREKKRLEREPSAKDAEGIRFSPKWVAADRKRLGISAADYAALVGVSMLTVYNWEKGKSKPRAKQLAAWAKVRGIGKREAIRRLELLEA